MVQMSAMVQWLSALILKGMEGRSAADRRAALTLGTAAIFIFVAGLVLRIIYVFIKDPNYASLTNQLLILLSVMAFSLLAIPFVVRHSLMLAEVLLLTYGVTQVIQVAYSAGAGVGLHYNLIFVGYIIFAAIGTRFPLRITLYFLVILAVILLCNALFPQPRVFVNLSEERTMHYMQINILFGVLVTSILMLVFQRRFEIAEHALEAEHERSEGLLRNLLPANIAARLKAAPTSIIVDDVAECTILFADIVGFTPWSKRLPAPQVVATLNQIFHIFDELTARQGLEKIKTIGDAYMVVGGLPAPRSDHLQTVANLALQMLQAVRSLQDDEGAQVQLRIGISSGPAVAGVIGKTKVFYDVWGDTVNTAARLESHGEAGRIQITAQIRDRLGPGYQTEPRGAIEIKGLGQVETFWLLSGPMPLR